jgi:ATP-dependent DNA helicase PIF1
MSSITKTPLELNEGFRYALDVLEKSRQSLFLTGKAGTGKSTLLQLFRSTTRKKMVVLAPTGIAALNVQGQTIHSFFGFPPRLIQAKDISKNFTKKWFNRIEVIVIDEISMVRADMLDAIDRSLRLNRDSPLPFGGVQMVFIGDLFQLPPVVANEEERNLLEMTYDTPYFFSAKVLRDFEYEKMELRKVYRQEERHFLRLLEAVRHNSADWEDLEDLNQRCLPNFDAAGSFITLATRNAKVDRINLTELGKLIGFEDSFTAKIQGEFDPKQFPTEMELRLKVGAQVMFIKNDLDGNYVNGTIGKVTAFDEEGIKVFTDEQGSPKVINVVPAKWEIIRYRPGKENPDEIEAEVVGIFEQYPLRLAWAVTIHKSQGKTFDRVIIDMDSGAFEFGQTYVALSRCRTLEGIVLRQMLKPTDIMTDERVVDFYEQNF